MSVKPRSTPKIPALSDVKAEVAKSSKQERMAAEAEARALERTREIEAEHAYLKHRDFQGQISQKKHWSWFLIAAIAWLIVFQSLLLIAVGKEWLVFKDAKWIIPALLVQNLAQIVGLAVLVIKSIFSSRD